MPRGRDWLRGVVYPFPYRGFTHRYRCIFVHIPRTAGTSVLSALKERRHQVHCPWWVYQKADSRRYRTYFKFAFVRNPWDRLVSVYSYLKQGGCGVGDEQISALLNDRYPSFEAFVLEYLNESTIHDHRLFVPQYFYLMDFMDECRVDFVGRYERLADDFALVARKIGLRDSCLPRTNASARPHYRDCYRDPDVASRVGTLYVRDVKTFEYTL